jgi:hypothetical protein
LRAPVRWSSSTTRSRWRSPRWQLHRGTVGGYCISEIHAAGIADDLDDRGSTSAGGFTPEWQHGSGVERPCPLPPPSFTRSPIPSSPVTAAIKGGAITIATTTPTACLLTPSCPYKRDSPHCPPSHLSPLSFSPLCARALPAPSATTATSSPPSPRQHHCSPRMGEQRNGFATLPSPSPTPPVRFRAPERSEANSDERATMSQWPVVRAASAGPRWTRHPDVVHGLWTEST